MSRHTVVAAAAIGSSAEMGGMFIHGTKHWQVPSSLAPGV